MTKYEQNGKTYIVSYDLDNRITTAKVGSSTVTYRYDALGRRVIRKQGATKSALIWWGNSECAEHKHVAGQTVIQNDIMSHPTRLNSVIARAVKGSKYKLSWYHKNYLDHVYAVSNQKGDLIEHYRYSAFGEAQIYDRTGVAKAKSQINNQIMWNTRRLDPVTGYYLYKYRHYSPELGRWPSRDPIEEHGGINLYAFVGNNPVNYWDKLGLLPKKYPKGKCKKEKGGVVESVEQSSKILVANNTSNPMEYTRKVTNKGKVSMEAGFQGGVKAGVAIEVARETWTGVIVPTKTKMELAKMIDFTCTCMWTGRWWWKPGNEYEQYNELPIK